MRSNQATATEATLMDDFRFEITKHDEPGALAPDFDEFVSTAPSSDGQPADLQTCCACGEVGHDHDSCPYPNAGYVISRQRTKASGEGR